MSPHQYVACDLGAESGRIMLGTLADHRLTVEEIHRFPNGPVVLGDTLRWDVLRLFDEIKLGLRKVAARGAPAASMSTDAWGVDYVLLRDDEPFLTAPYHYRDARTDGALERAFARVPAGTIFEETGAQFMAHNTLFQLLVDREHRREILELSDRFLGIADYFNYLFSGVARAEESYASTTQLWNPRQRAWSRSLIDDFGLPARIFPEVVPSGTVLGPMTARAAAEVGLPGIQVIASCSHDTGAAVAAVPAEGGAWAYLSSGTWSLIGIELPEPLITKKVRALNITNEIGYGHSIRFLKITIGLWIVQECRRAWAQAGEDYSYARLAEMADQGGPSKSLIDPTAPQFAKPGEMPRKVADYCRQTGQPVPRTAGETVRCAFESLALLYRLRLEELTDATGRKIDRLHVVGGGSQGALLSQLTANAMGLPVLCGPVEATAIGNLLVQAMALGHLRSHTELRRVVRESFPIVTYQPRDEELWRPAYDRFRGLVNREG